MKIAVSTKINLFQKPNSRERLIFFAAMLAMSAVFVRSCVLTSTKAVRTVQEEIQKADTERQQYMTAIQMAKAKKLAADVKAAGMKKKKLPFVGPKGSLEEVVEVVAQPAHLHSVKLSRTQFSEVKDADALSRRDAAIGFAGTFISARNYLEYLESTSIPMVIERFSLEVEDEQPNQVNIDVQGGFHALK